MTATIKPDYAITLHRDGTVSCWDVMTQTWVRVSASHISDATMSGLTATDRRRIAAHSRHAEA